MDHVVADSSVSIKWFTTEVHSAEARRILQEYQAGSLVLLAPDLIYCEFGNIVWKKHLFHGLDAADAQRIIAAFQRLRFQLTSTALLLDDAYRLAVAHRLTVYDAMYLALSVRENCRFVTADEKLVQALGAAFPHIVRVADWT